MEETQDLKQKLTHLKTFKIPQKKNFPEPESDPQSL